MLFENSSSTVVAAVILAFAIMHVDTIAVTKTPEKTRPTKRWNSPLKSSPKPVQPKTNESTKTGSNGTKGWLFKDCMKKYRPVNVWERLSKQNKGRTLNMTLDKDFNAFFNGIDVTDDLFRIKVGSTQESARRSKWSPPGYIDKSVVQRDQFSLRRRLYELILHVMYWTRNKLVLMQEFRKKYRDSKLYKMGFMMSKTDIACKMFHRFSYRAMHSCQGFRYGHVKRFYPIEILHAEERMNYKWFDITLLAELIIKNDESAKEMIQKVDKNRKVVWKFQD